MSHETLTPSMEDYLKTIYNCTCGDKAASTNQLAEALKVKPASVTGMIQKMSQVEPPLVDYHKHYGVRLTPHGEKLALKIIRHHRLLEAYLFEILGYPWDQVHSEACRLEHVISDDFERRIAAALGNPTRDPHGAPIPSNDLSMPVENILPLASLRADETATIKRVSDHDPALLRHLHDIGLVPGARVKVKDYCTFDNNLTLQVEGQKSKVVLGLAVTSHVFVEK